MGKKVMENLNIAIDFLYSLSWVVWAVIFICVSFSLILWRVCRMPTKNYELINGNYVEVDVVKTDTEGREILDGETYQVSNSTIKDIKSRYRNTGGWS